MAVRENRDQVAQVLASKPSGAGRKPAAVPADRAKYAKPCSGAGERASSRSKRFGGSPGGRRAGNLVRFRAGRARRIVDTSQPFEPIHRSLSLQVNPPLVIMPGLIDIARGESCRAWIDATRKTAQSPTRRRRIACLDLLIVHGFLNLPAP